MKRDLKELFEKTNQKYPVKDTSKSKAELKSLDLDKERENSAKNHKHKIFILTLYVLWIFAILVFITRLLHFIFPTCWYWLDTNQIQSLDKFLFSGVIGSILGKYGNKAFNGDS